MKIGWRHSSSKTDVRAGRLQQGGRYAFYYHGNIAMIVLQPHQRLLVAVDRRPLVLRRYRVGQGQQMKAKKPGLVKCVTTVVLHPTPTHPRFLLRKILFAVRFGTRHRTTHGSTNETLALCGDSLSETGCPEPDSVSRRWMQLADIDKTICDASRPGRFFALAINEQLIASDSLERELCE